VREGQEGLLQELAEDRPGRLGQPAAARREVAPRGGAEGVVGRQRTGPPRSAAAVRRGLGGDGGVNRRISWRNGWWSEDVWAWDGGVCLILRSEYVPSSPQ
jgi:hypothetical protein